MDSYRENMGQFGQANEGSHGEDDIGHEPPPASIVQDERRMQVRAYNYWASLLGDRPFPQIADLAAGPMPGFANHAVVLDFSKDNANPAVTMLGEKLAEECGAAMTIANLSDVPERSLLARITSHYLQILANQAPIGFEAEFVNQRGKTLLYRGILLPFSSDGETIQHIMGVINWKELADPVVTAELRDALAVTVGTGHSPGASALLGIWADGPVAIEPAEAEMTTPVSFRAEPRGSLIRTGRRSRRTANRSQDTGQPVPDRLAGRLRKLPTSGLQSLSVEGSEFALVLIRRVPGGSLQQLGECHDKGTIERAAWHLLSALG
jgi:hypothetical protein